MAKARQKRAKSGRKEGVLRELNTNKTLYLMCLPALLLLFLLCYLPFGGIWMAFTDFNALDGVFGSPFVGLRNFSIFFKQLTAWNVVKNTLIINFFGIILGLIVPISLAIFLNEMRLGIYKRVVQSVMFFPYFLSWVVVGAIVYGLLATDVGVVNNVLKSMDMEPVRWFAEPKYWKTMADRRGWRSVLTAASALSCCGYMGWFLITPTAALFAAPVLQCIATAGSSASSLATLNMEYASCPEEGKTVYLGAVAVVSNLMGYMATLAASGIQSTLEHIPRMLLF